MKISHVGLHPYYYRLLNPEEKLPAYAAQTSDAMEIDVGNRGNFHKRDKFAFPSFPNALDYFFNNIHQNTTTWGPGDILVANLMPPEVFSTALTFVRRVAFMEALDGEEVLVDEDWERKLDIAAERDDKIREKLRVYFRILYKENPRALERFLTVAWEGMVYGDIGVEGVRDVWVELVGVVPGEVLEGFVGRVGELRRCILAGMKLEGRAITARALGLLGSHPAVDQEILKGLITEMTTGAENWKKAGGQELNRVHGSILALGYLLARLRLRRRLDVLDGETIGHVAEVIVVVLLEGRDQMILDAAITAFSEICVFGVMGGEHFEAPKSNKILERLGELEKKGKEKAILAMGYFSIIFPEAEIEVEERKEKSMVQKILERLFSLHENRQIEVNFATGEAVASVAGGWESKGVKGKVDLDGFEGVMVKKGKKEEGRLAKVVEEVLGFVKETKPALRKVCYSSG